MSKASVDDTQAWAELDNGPAVNAKWSEYTQLKAAEAKIREAEYEAGLVGMAETGVE
jgi:hypothetical protein